MDDAENSYKLKQFVFVCVRECVHPGVKMQRWFVVCLLVYPCICTCVRAFFSVWCVCVRVCVRVCVILN